ncbi:MAG: phosphonate ABC transporter ATP-binding protein [Hyphomicrobiales bacterium]|nr:phosphonate ABC transporter ATP-binding protein [Hyphomicrobiales bacterium]
MTEAIAVTHVWKSYERGKPVLKDVSFTIQKGEMVALIGASGSGKSTLIKAIAGLTPVDRPEANSGDRCCEIAIMGELMQEGGRIRNGAGDLRRRVAVVFQQFNLVPRLSVLTNVLLGLLGRTPRWRGTLGLFTHTEKQRAMSALARVGIAEQALSRGSAISGGQQQRAAIARSMVQEADVLIADEPIASLDPSASRRVMDILQDFNRSDGVTVLVSLHQVEYALRYCARTIALRNGEVVYDGPSDALTPRFLNDLYGAESVELFLPGFAEQPGAAPVAGFASPLAPPAQDLRDATPAGSA